MSGSRLAVLHTVVALADQFKARIVDRYGDLDCFHMVDESLLQDLMRNGPSQGITDRVVQQATLAEKAGATAILFTCSSTSPAVDAARKAVRIPIIKIDDAMAATAVQSGSRIGVVCTTSSTMEPSRKLLLQHAAETGREIEVEVLLAEGAFERRASGDHEQHDALVRQTAMQLGQRNHVVVLAQASLAHLQPELSELLSVPVLASPELCIADLGERLQLN